MLNQKQRSVPVHDFALNPRTGAPRSAFPLDHVVKMPFNFSDLVPILIEEVLPGETWKCRIQAVARTAVPIVPIQDNWHLEFFSFFVPMRLVWTNARKFWGEQDNPGDSTSYTIPGCTHPVGGWPIASIGDYFGLPTVGQVVPGISPNGSALPLRAYNLIFNQWFRDENLQSSLTVNMGDGPDLATDYQLMPRGKRFDYFNQALPWPQKGNTAVTFPLGTSAPVLGNPVAGENYAEHSITGDSAARMLHGAATSTAITWSQATTGGVTGTQNVFWTPGYRGTTTNSHTGLIADLTQATAGTVNQLRTAITLQQYLEKDARGGTRYTEFVYNMFGVRSPDARLQRPEFIGGGHCPITTTAIPQTSATGLTGATTPIGTLAATGHLNGKTGFTYASTEHGFILTLVSARADITYQQGVRKMWNRSTRYDYPVPLLANLGEQAVLNREIYSDGNAADANVFGYVPRWDEYRHFPSRIAGIYRSTAAGTIDYWHSAEKFTAAPALNAAYITDKAKSVVQRNFSAGATTLGQQILADFYFSGSVVRPLPAYGVPGLTRF